MELLGLQVCESLSVHCCAEVSTPAGRPFTSQVAGVHHGCHLGRKLPSLAGMSSPQRRAICTKDVSADTSSLYPMLSVHSAPLREAVHKPRRWRPPRVPPWKKVAQPRRHVISPAQGHVYQGRECRYILPLSYAKRPLRSSRPCCRVYPRVTVPASCSGTRVSDSVHRIARSSDPLTTCYLWAIVVLPAERSSTLDGPSPRT